MMVPYPNEADYCLLPSCKKLELFDNWFLRKSKKKQQISDTESPVSLLRDADLQYANSPHPLYFVWHSKGTSMFILETFLLLTYTYTGCSKKNAPTLQCHIFKNTIHVFSISITFISILRLRFPKN